MPDEPKLPEKKLEQNSKAGIKDKDGLGGYLRGVGYAYAKGGFLDDEPTAKKRKVEGSSNSVDKDSDEDDSNDRDRTR